MWVPFEGRKHEYMKLFFITIILNSSNITLLQDTILSAVRASRSQQISTIQSPIKPYKWTYASAFLYSLTLITTIGKCFIPFLYNNIQYIYTSIYVCTCNTIECHIFTKKWYWTRNIFFMRNRNYTFLWKFISMTMHSAIMHIITS